MIGENDECAGPSGADCEKASGCRRLKIASYNSDFLSGLFADDAKTYVLKEFQIQQSSPDAEDSSEEGSNDITKSSSRSLQVATEGASKDDDEGTKPSISSSHVVYYNSNDDSPRPTKRNKTNVHSSFCPKRDSFAYLLSATLPRQQEQKNGGSKPEHSNHCASGQSTAAIRVAKNMNFKNQNSLAFQLNCLETQNPASSKVSGTVSNDFAIMAFPNLPSAVSASSCESNDQGVVQCTISSFDFSSGKESFGWFVDLEYKETCELNGYQQSLSSGDACGGCNNEPSPGQQNLAFQVPTAPKRSSNYMEQMEQAYAEDTIDSVLGDLRF